MADRHSSGILDTCVFIDVDEVDDDNLPLTSEITAITLAELQQGVIAARDNTARAVRMERLSVASTEFDPLAFDGEAAARYGTLVGLTVAAGRDPKPRRFDLMIAAIASVHGLPLFTRNGKDFKGLERVVTVVSV